MPASTVATKSQPALVLTGDRPLEPLRDALLDLAVLHRADGRDENEGRQHHHEHPLLHAS
jgi:hypothetical protein